MQMAEVTKQLICLFCFILQHMLVWPPKSHKCWCCFIFHVISY